MRACALSLVFAFTMALVGCTDSNESPGGAESVQGPSGAGYMPEGAVVPTPQAIASFEYPLARPLFLYVDKKELTRPEVVAFLQFYLSDAGQKLVKESKYTPLAPEELAKTRSALDAAIAEAGGVKGAAGELSGEFTVDGSSTVYPISLAMVEEFSKEHRQVRIPVVRTGSGTGFKRLVNGEIAIADASRAIKPSELAAARENGIEPVELKVAIDGITVVVNPANDWVAGMTMDQLKKIWEPGSTIRKWSDINPDWPDEDLVLCGPGQESGTFDYFTEEVVGEAKKCRNDYTPSGDDNILVNIIIEDENALGYFGYAYYAENKDMIKALAIAEREARSAEGAGQPADANE